MLPFPGSYSPFVLTARSNKYPKLWTNLRFFRFVVITSGQHVLKIGDQFNTFESGEVYLITPQSSVDVSFDELSRAITVDFSVTHCDLIARRKRI